MFGSPELRDDGVASGFLPAQQRRSFELKRLRPRHRRILDLYRRGLPLREIARTVGMSESAIDYTVHSRVAVAELDRLDRETEWTALADESARRARISHLSGVSLVELERVLRSEETPPRLRVRVALAVLDRANVTGSIRRQSTADRGMAETLRAIWNRRRGSVSADSASRPSRDPRPETTAEEA